MRRLALLLALAAACASPEPDTDGTLGGGSDGKADGWGSATSTKTLVLRGTVVTMDEARGSRHVLYEGAVVVKGQKITAVLEKGQPLPTGSDVTVLPSATGSSDWVITPGLINAHNHLAYNTAQIYRDLPLYENTYQWRDEDYYDTHIQLPKRVLGACSIDVDEVGIGPDNGDHEIELSGLIGRYSEAKEIVSGTTTTQGSYFGTVIHKGYGEHLARNLDGTNFGHKRIGQVALGILVSSFDPRTVVERMDDGELDGWLVHLLEGTDQASTDEFDCLRAMGLVREELIIIHGIALTRDQLAEMGQVGAKLVASPLDNLLYYGQTADLKTAKQMGVKISIGTDWTPAGSKNLLVELKVLDLLNKQIWGNAFTTREMLAMVTTNPADSIGWSQYVGRVKPGLYADLAVFRRRSSPYRSVIDATEKDVKLVLVGGDPLFGDVNVMKKLKPTDHEVVQAGCGFSKAIDLTNGATKVEHGDLHLSEVADLLGTALQFDRDWLYEHHEEGRAAGRSPTQFDAYLDSKYPYEMEPRELNPLFACDDQEMLTEIRLDPNIRTAYGGICLDLRPWYGGASTPDCGAMPAHPPVLTVEEHDGSPPQRPADWCAEQDWFVDGALPRP